MILFFLSIEFDHEDLTTCKVLWVKTNSLFKGFKTSLKITEQIEIYER